MNQHQKHVIRDAYRHLHMNTAAIGKKLNIPEPEVDRVIHEMLDRSYAQRKRWETDYADPVRPSQP